MLYRHGNYVASNSNRNYGSRISSTKTFRTCARDPAPLGGNRPERHRLVGIHSNAGDGEERHHRMKRYGHLYEKLIDPENVRAALMSAARGKRDRAATAACLADPDKAAAGIIAHIEGGVAPSPPSTFDRYDPARQKWRSICCPRFYPDQVVHHALMRVLSPCILRGMSDACMATVPGRGQHASVRRVSRWLDEDRKHTKYALQLDIHHFYQNVDREKLKARLRRLVKDGRFLAALDAVIDAAPGTGLPIGYYTSQWLANLFLQDLDHLCEAMPGCAHYQRYMDDMLLLGPNKRALHRSRRAIEGHLAGLGLALKPNWQVFRVSDDRPITWLGYKLRRGRFTQVSSRTFLRDTRRIRRIAAKPRMTSRDAREVMSYKGVFAACGTQGILQERVYKYVSIKQARRVIRNETSGEHREAARRRGGARR